MFKLLYRDELVSKIKLFNEIFQMDFMNSNEENKSWKSYLDPIAKYLFDKSYISFINENPLEANVPPGSLEAYYNLFSYVVNDLQSMVSLKIPNEVFCAASDVKKTFDEFISVNRFKVSKATNSDLLNPKVIYHIYPTI